VNDALLELQNFMPTSKPTSPENFHLTLVFMDEQPDELIEEVHHALDQLHVPKFEIALNGLDAFGGREPNILYVGVEKVEALKFLQKKVIGVLRSAGVSLDRKRFRPHVTIARFGRRLSKEELESLRNYMSGHADFGPVSFTVGSFSIYRSTLSHKGAVHDELAQYELV
jgi:2'-5' RNA ligase